MPAPNALLLAIESTLHCGCPTACLAVIAAAGEEVPQELLSVLALGGRMVIPVGKRHGAQVCCRLQLGAWETQDVYIAAKLQLYGSSIRQAAVGCSR